MHITRLLSNTRMWYVSYTLALLIALGPSAAYAWCSTNCTGEPCGATSGCGLVLEPQGFYGDQACGIGYCEVGDCWWRWRSPLNFQCFTCTEGGQYAECLWQV